MQNKSRTHPKTGYAGPKSSEKAVDKARETAISKGDMALQRNDVHSLHSRLKPVNSFGMGSKYWLMKSEPLVYSIDTLKKDTRTPWEGVRNYQARNYMRDEMKQGDLVLFYHSNADPTGVAGIGRVCRESYPDFTAWDTKSKYFDPKTDKNNPRWFMVDVEFVEKFKSLVTLQQIKTTPSLQDMFLIKRGRLSVQPVEKKHFEIICTMGKNS